MQIPHTMKKLALAASVGALLLPVASAPAHAACYDYRRAEKRFARKINNSRQNHGLSRLRLDPELSKVAKVHTKDMIQRGGLFHQSSSLLDRRITNWALLGENVGRGSGVTSLHGAFMGSAPHRTNVLNSRFRYVGAGVLRRDGQMWVTIIFEATENPGTTLDMPGC